MDTNTHAIFWLGDIESMMLGHQLCEVYKDRTYEPFLGGRSDLTILDIGGNIGVTSMYFSKFAKRVVTLEPSTEHYSMLVQNIKFNNLTNVTPIMKALYINDGNLPFFHNPNRTMFSLHTAVRDDAKPETVGCVRIDTLLKDLEIEQVDFMKLDVEGSETEIVSSESFKNVADKIKILMGEYHDWSGRHPNQLKEALESYGFTFNWLKSDAKLFVATK